MSKNTSSNNHNKEKPATQEKIILHRAKLVIDWDGTVFSPEVLKEVNKDCVVRLSMVMPDPPVHLWSHDAPYVSIVEIVNGRFLGEVLDMSRDIECGRYPISSGDRIWFDDINIIEIPLREQSKAHSKKMRQHLTTERVNVTGPLYTIEEDEYNFVEARENSYDSYSDDDDVIPFTKE